MAAHQHRPKKLVNRVVPANVLGTSLEPTLGIEQAGSMQATGLVEGVLSVSQRARHSRNHVRVELPLHVQGWLVDFQGLECSPTAQPTRGILRDVPARCEQVWQGLSAASAEDRIDHVRSLGFLDTLDVGGRANDPLGEQKSGGEIDVRAGVRMITAKDGHSGALREALSRNRSLALCNRPSATRITSMVRELAFMAS